MLRVFVRDSIRGMQDVLPDAAEDAAALIDPGEWAVQNYWCRVVCVFIFMLAMIDDLNLSYSLLTLLHRVPTSDAKWLSYEVPKWGAKSSVKTVKGWQEINLVKFRIAGMPMAWKLVNLVFIVLPKLLVWYTVASLGCEFIMETAGIVRAVLNSMALTFVLSMDELVFDVLTTCMAKHIMNDLEPYTEPEDDEGEDKTEDEVLQQYYVSEVAQRDWVRFFCMLPPKRLLRVLGLVMLFLGKYYMMNCQFESDGSWVSIPMFLPRVDFTFNLFEFLIGGVNSVDRAEETPYWRMPP